jgi:hypothetical protein
MFNGRPVILIVNVFLLISFFCLESYSQIDAIPKMESYFSCTQFSKHYSRKTIAADADNDGKNEIIMGWRDTLQNDNTAAGTSYVTIYRQNGNSYDSIWTFKTGSNWAFPLVADVNNDGKNELIISCGHIDNQASFVAIFSYSGSNNWQQKWYRDFPTIRRPRAVSVGDVDNDGKNELVVGVDWWGRTLYVLRCQNDSTYNELWSTGGNDFRSVSIGDVDLDGKNEMVIGTGNWSWYDWRVYKWNSSSYNLSFNSGILGSVDALIGDADNDGNNEIISAIEENSSTINDLRIYKWNGTTYSQIWSWGKNLATFGTAIGRLIDTTQNQITVFSGSQASKWDIASDTHIRDSSLHVFQFDGTTFNEICRKKFSTPYHGYCEICDADNDGKNELIFSHNDDGVFFFKPLQYNGPQVFSINPNKGGNAGLVTVEIRGINLKGKLYIRLTRIGYNPILADSNRTELDSIGVFIKTTFNLKNASEGNWNLEIENANSSNVIKNVLRGT